MHETKLFLVPCLLGNHKHVSTELKANGFKFSLHPPQERFACRTSILVHPTSCWDEEYNNTSVYEFHLH